MQDIRDAMLAAGTGLTFISKTPPLPATTFVAAEAILWLMEHVESVAGERRAITIMEDMLARNMIRHASGDPRAKFLYGFHMYYICTEQGQAASPYQGDMWAYRSDWIEVGLELFRPERDELDLGNCLDDEFENSFLHNNIRRFSGNIGDFNKPNTYKVCICLPYLSVLLDLILKLKVQGLRVQELHPGRGQQQQVGEARVGGGEVSR